MTLSVPRAPLAAALSTLADVVDARAAIPVLSHVLMRVSGDTLSLSGTDLDHQMTVDVPGVTGKLDDCLPNFATLRAAATSLIGDAVEMKLDAKAGALKLSAGKATRTVRTLGVDDFPALPDNDEGAVLALPAPALRKALDFARVAVCADGVRYYLHGVFAEPDDAGINFVATDGNRLHCIRVDMARPEGMAPVTLPTRLAAMICKLADEGDCELRIGPKRAHYTAGGVNIASKLVEGNFPEYRRVIPSGGDKTLTAGAEELARAALAAASVASEKVRAVRLDAGADDVTFSCTAAENGSSALEPVRDADWKGGAFAIGFNAGLFASTLRCFGERQVEIAMSAADAPTLVTSATLPEALAVIMPMRV
jgi:DNA polymerase-3 subunit beta